jgi:hypothetical protein
MQTVVSVQLSFLLSRFLAWRDPDPVILSALTKFRPIVICKGGVRRTLMNPSVWPLAAAVGVGTVLLIAAENVIQALGGVYQ